MGILIDHCDEEVEVPDSVIKFLHEYEKLCRKFDLMICPNGEPVTVGPANEDLWGVRQSTADWIKRYGSID